MNDTAADPASTVEEHRRLIAIAILKLREGGKLISTCTIQAALRQTIGIELSLREIIEARRPR